MWSSFEMRLRAELDKGLANDTRHEPGLWAH